MGKEAVLKNLTNAIIRCEKLEKSKELAKKALSQEAPPKKIIEAIKKGLNKIGELYEKGDYYLMELVLGGSIAVEILKLVKLKIKKVSIPNRGKIVLGTVYGDIHHIGKDILKAMFESQAFNVIDLGVNVPTENFISAVKEKKPHIVAMSGLLTYVVDEMEKVVEKLRKEGLRDTVKVMIGGRAVSQEFAQKIGADAFCATAIEAVNLAINWVGSN